SDTPAKAPHETHAPHSRPGRLRAGRRTNVVSMPRPDFSEYVVHFTKSARPFGLARAGAPRVPGLTEIGALSAYERLVAMLQQGVIRATNMPWTDKPCVCFTECVWGSLLDHALRYSHYGIGFHKKALFAAGGGPAIYMRQDLFRAAA